MQVQKHVIERLGAYHRTIEMGLHYVVPILDRVATVVSLKEMVKDFAPQPVITKDNVTMQIDTVVYYQITDPKLYTYGVENPISAIENLTASLLALDDIKQEIIDIKEYLKDEDEYEESI